MGTPLSRTVSDGGGFFSRLPLLRSRSKTAPDVNATRVEAAEAMAKLSERVMGVFLEKLKVIEIIPQEIFRGSISSTLRDDFKSAFSLQDEKALERLLEKAPLLTLSSFLKVVFIEIQENYMFQGEALEAGFIPYVFDQEEIKNKFLPFFTSFSKSLEEIVSRSNLSFRSLSLASGENFSKMLYPLALFPKEHLPEEDARVIALLKINNLTK